MKIAYQKIQKIILDRYQHNARSLPRRQTIDPYQIMVSEIMLQQTQVDRVIPKYLHFLELFPTLQSLADADKTTLLTARSGLGYNSRAINLQKAAQVIVKEYKNTFPQTKEELIKLPGIGPYTAGAICAFAYNQDVTVIDINIKRVLIHLLHLDPNISPKDLEKIVAAILPTWQSRTRYNALMDYGALVLTSKKTGIRSPAQSKFQGSARQVRGNLIKHLTKFSPIAVDEAKKKFYHSDFDKIIEKMKQQGIIHVINHTISL
jgi:A/G-specific adenine glycosylase